MNELPTIALLGGVAPEVHNAVSANAILRPMSDLTLQECATVQMALTNAMAGAKAADLDMFPKVKRIVSCGAGLDGFDTEDLKKRGIELCPTGHLMNGDTAEMAVALTFGLLRRLVVNHNHVIQGHWASGRPQNATRIAGRRVGIVGLGQIGRTVAGLFEGLGTQVAYTGPNRKDTPWRYFDTIDKMADWADVLILTCPGGSATEGLVNQTVLAKLGAQGFLVNISRGTVVVEADLQAALTNGVIAGAALDVFLNEPAPWPELLACPNLLLSPHAATLTQENRAELASEVLHLLKLKT